VIWREAVGVVAETICTRIGRLIVIGAREECRKVRRRELGDSLEDKVMLGGIDGRSWGRGHHKGRR
jgi:hypothetical protein